MTTNPKHKSAPNKARGGSEIDDLFQSLKTQKKEQVAAEEKQQQDAKKALAKQQEAKQQLEAQIKKLEAQSTSAAFVLSD